jgi:hypothetical protein
MSMRNKPQKHPSFFFFSNHGESFPNVLIAFLPLFIEDVKLDVFWEGEKTAEISQRNGGAQGKESDKAHLVYLTVYC